MLLSVVVSTSPQREKHLQCCLKMLERQTYKPFEVIVVDDGSKKGETIATIFESSLKLSYLWRPNDCCVSRSRNLGASFAQGEGLVFIDTDVLLNPLALEYYASTLTQQQLLYGYCGNNKLLCSCSCWFPDHFIHWEDIRFRFSSLEEVNSPSRLFKEPFKYAWSGNFGLKQKTFQWLGGFNESLIGWGFEDIEFAYRGVKMGCHIDFSLEVWAEQMIHRIDIPFHEISEQKQFKESKDKMAKNLVLPLIPIPALYDENIKLLLKAIATYYPLSVKSLQIETDSTAF